MIGFAICTETAPARVACRGRLCRNSRLGGSALGEKVGQPRFLHSGNESGGLFAAISLRLVGRALRLRLRGITDSLSQHLAKLGLGLRRFPRIGLCPCGHKQYVGMPEVELNPAGSANSLLKNSDAGLQNREQNGIQKSLERNRTAAELSYSADC